MEKIAVAGFDWDEGNLTKCAKHGVSVEEIEAFFLAGPAVAPDPVHSAVEDRLIAVGRPHKAGHFSWPSPCARSRAKDSSARSARDICTRRKSRLMKRVPKLKSDKAAEAFLDRDLSGLDFSQFKPVRFEFEKKTARVNMRLPQTLLDAVKKRATSRKVPYQRFIREALEQAVASQK